MAINCQQLYRDVLSTIGVGVGNSTTEQRFTRAVNRSLDELSIAEDRATRYPHISGPSSTISDLDDNYEWILAAGVAFYMTRLGQRPSDPALTQIVYNDTRDEWDRAKGEYVRDLWNIEQSTDSNSIIGLGYVGS